MMDFLNSFASAKEDYFILPFLIKVNENTSLLFCIQSFYFSILVASLLGRFTNDILFLFLEENKFNFII